MGCVLALAKSLEGRDRNCFYVFPTYKQAKQVAWKLLKKLAGRYAVLIHETELTIELVNGSVVGLRGADKPDSLRGVGLDYVILDEYGDMRPEAWREVLRPALADRLGGALLIGTPKGWNHFKEEWDRAWETPNWQAWQFTTLQGGNVSLEEVEENRRTMDPRTFRQEFEASFESVTGRIFYGFGRMGWPVGSVCDDLVIPEGVDVLVGMDFNVDPMTAACGVRAADQLHVVQEIVLPDANTEAMAQALKTRFPRNNIVVFPDPSGRARKTSAKVGVTDLTILRDHGFRVSVPKAAPSVKDSSNEVNAMLLNAANERRLLVHPACKTVIRSLDGLTWKKGQEGIEPDKSGGLDHAADALRYLVHGEFPMKSKGLEPMPLSAVI